MLSESQRQIRDIARRFAQRELAPTVAERDRNPRFPREAFAKMGELGMLGMTVPAGIASLTEATLPCPSVVVVWAV